GLFGRLLEVALRLLFLRRGALGRARARELVDLGAILLELDHRLSARDRIAQAALDHLDLGRRQVERPDAATEPEAERVQRLLVPGLDLAGGAAAGLPDFVAAGVRDGERKPRQEGKRNPYHGAHSTRT